MRGQNSESSGPAPLPVAPPGTSPDAVAILQQLERILADERFKKSKRYSDLLRFIVEHSLKGQLEELRERMIGYELFGRSADYDVSIDPTVRVVATEVRKRLALYYSTPEHHGELTIEIPGGAYVAEFHSPRPDAPTAVAEVAPVAKSSRRIRQLVAGVVVAMLLAGSCYLGWRYFAASSIQNKFWRPLQSKSTIISVGASFADSADQAMAQSVMGGQEEPSTRYLGFSDCCGNVSMLDVHVSQGLSDHLKKLGVNPLIRATRGTTFADLSAGPILLVGLNNEWLIKLGHDLPFRFNTDGMHVPDRIVDVGDPSQRQWARLPSQLNREEGMDYALVSRIHDPSTGHWWIGLAGLTGPGTVRAQEFLTSDRAMESLAGLLPKGWEQKNLQIILAVRLVKGIPGSAQVVTVHVW